MKSEIIFLFMIWPIYNTAGAEAPSEHSLEYSLDCERDGRFECFPLCIPQDWICDGEEDCVEGSDEENCTQHFSTTTVTERLKSKEFFFTTNMEEELTEDSETTAVSEFPPITLHYNQSEEEKENTTNLVDEGEFIVWFNDSHTTLSDFENVTDSIENTSGVVIDSTTHEAETSSLDTETYTESVPITESSSSMVATTTSPNILTITPTIQTEKLEGERKVLESKIRMARKTNPKEISQHDLHPNLKYLINVSKLIQKLRSDIQNGHLSCSDELENKLISKITCPHHFEFISGYCIKVQIYPPLNWDEAVSLCQSHGGSLISISNNEIHKKLIQQLSLDKQRGYSLWVGASNGNDGIWKWQNGQPVQSFLAPDSVIELLEKYALEYKPLANRRQCAFLNGNRASMLTKGNCALQRGFICKSEIISHEFEEE